MTSIDSTPFTNPANPTWGARFRFVRDLAPTGQGTFMAPDHAVILRLNDRLYMRAPYLAGALVIAWVAAVLMLGPVVSLIGFGIWSALVAGGMILFLSGWANAPRPLRRPGAASSWAGEHISNLWLLFIAFGTGAALIFPDTGFAHQRVLCMILIGAGSAGALFSSSSIRGLAATLAPTIGLPSLVLLAKGEYDLAALMALAGGIAVTCGLILMHVTAERARHDVDSN